MQGIMPQSGVQDHVERIHGTNWAEEMDILNLVLEEEPSYAACIVEVTPCTKACIKMSFQFMSNTAQRSLRSRFNVLKASITIVLHCLDRYVWICA